MIIVLDDDDDIYCELLMLTDVKKLILIKNKNVTYKGQERKEYYTDNKIL